MISQQLALATATGQLPNQPQVQVGQPGWQDGAMARLTQGTTKGNLSNADVGGGQRGFVVDVNGDGQYGRGQDAVLGMDFDGDGSLNQKEIGRTRELLSSFAGNNDFDGDGKVSKAERKRAAGYRALDKDGDGRLSTPEMQMAGARTWVDRNGDGKVGGGEVAGIQNFRTNNPLNAHSLNGLDATGTRSSVSSTVDPRPAPPPGPPRPPSRASSRAKF